MAEVQYFAGRSSEMFKIQLFFYRVALAVYQVPRDLSRCVVLFIYFDPALFMVSELCCQLVCFCKTILPELTILTFDIGSILQFL